MKGCCDKAPIYTAHDAVQPSSAIVSTRAEWLYAHLTGSVGQYLPYLTFYAG